ncbi:MAG: hypothetical protein WBW34_05245, partial [Nitrososphaeraceae archaeon]
IHKTHTHYQVYLLSLWATMYAVKGLNITNIDHLGNEGYLFPIGFLGFRNMSNMIRTPTSPCPYQCFLVGSQLG